MNPTESHVTLITTSKKLVADEDRKQLRKETCTTTCPDDLCACVLTTGHNGPHECPQGHTWL